jgi:hypothetical protein
MLDISTGRGLGALAGFGFGDPSVVGFDDSAAGVFGVLAAVPAFGAFGVLAFALALGLLGVLLLHTGRNECEHQALVFDGV